RMAVEVAEELEVRPVGRQSAVDRLEAARGDHRTAAALGVGVDDRDLDIQAAALAGRHGLVAPQQAERLALTDLPARLAASPGHEEALDGGDHHALEGGLGD